MKNGKLFLVMCLIGLSTFTVKSSLYGQNKIYANHVADSSADFRAARLSVDAQIDNFAYISASAGVLSSSHLTFNFPSSAKAGDAITVQVQSEGLLGASVLNNITLHLYDVNGVNVANASGSSILQLSLLSPENNMYAVRFITDINANYTFNQVVVELNNLLSVNLLNEFRVYGMFFQPSCPAVKANSLFAYGTNSMLSGFVVDPTYAADADIATYATLQVPLNLLGLLPPAFLDLNFGVAGNAGEYVGFTVSESASLLSLALLSNITITAFDASNNIVANKSGFTLLDLKLIGGSTNKYTLGFVTPAGSYSISRLKINMTGVIGVLESINVHDAFHYRIDATPVAISASGALTFCNDSTVVLTANMPATGNTFQWSNGATTPSITVNSSGNYSVEVTDGSGCSYSSVQVPVTEIAPIPATINVSNVKCNGENNGTAQIVIPASAGACTCLWNNGGTSLNVTAMIPANYSVAITHTSTGCITTFPVQITEPAPLTFSTTVSEETCNGNDARIQLSTSGGTFPYTFSTTATLLGNEVINLQAGSYSVLVSDANSCQYNATVAVTKVNCSTPINIHNVITPNNDGLNDVLVIEGIERYPASDLMVFDKWGDMVYEENHYSNSWRGGAKSKEDALPAGTYFYVLKLNAEEVPDGQKDYTGFILIQR